jgi:hypothetical protein
MNSPILRALALAASLSPGGCSRRPPVPPPPQPAPQELLGRFIDDYGDRFTISAADWIQHPDSGYTNTARYHIRRWDSAGQYLIAENDSANPSGGGRWTRIDWLPLTGMAPWTWGFCLSAYDAPTATAAESVTVARRDTPMTGCNGHPFSRMRRLAAGDR